MMCHWKGGNGVLDNGSRSSGGLGDDRGPSRSSGSAVLSSILRQHRRPDERGGLCLPCLSVLYDESFLSPLPGWDSIMLLLYAGRVSCSSCGEIGSPAPKQDDDRNECHEAEPADNTTSQYALSRFRVLW